MNVAIVLLLAWRIYVAVPIYAAIAVATLGYRNDAKVDIQGTNWSTLIGITAGRAFMFGLDWALFRFILPWPYNFFFGLPSNPTSWRRAVGFRDEEIVVRVSRKWYNMLPQGWLDEQLPQHERERAEVFQNRIMPAIDPTCVQAKTGYVMMDKNWDLDFAAMIAAHRLLAEGKISLDKFQKTVILHLEPHGWLIWPIHQLDAGNQEVGRQKIVAFKDRLTAMGKESLFFRWIEIVQYESTLPGGFTPERQAAAMTKARDAFEAQGVDFDRFWNDVGGMEGMPGLDT